MGFTDKIVRIVIAISVIILYLMNWISGTLASVLLVFSVIFIVTSFIGFCPLYTILGINTCKKS